MSAASALHISLMSEPASPCPECGGPVQAFLRASTALTGMLGYCVDCEYEQIASPRGRGALSPGASLPPLFEEVRP